MRLSEILEDVSHDSINRFLLREQYTPKDLFEAVKGNLILTAGTLSVDDSVEDKPYRDPSKSAFVDFFWSGKHKRSVKGINLITLYYTDTAGSSYPVNFRLYNKQEGKTKNDYFREMVLEVVEWGLKPSWVTGDSWYSSLENLKFLRNQKVGFLFGIASNRACSSPLTRRRNDVLECNHMIIIYAKTAAKIQEQLQGSFLIGNCLLVYPSKDYRAARAAKLAVTLATYGCRRKPFIINLAPVVRLCTELGLGALPLLLFYVGIFRSLPLQIPHSFLDLLAAGFMFSVIVVSCGVYGIAVFILLSPLQFGGKKLLKTLAVIALVHIFLSALVISHLL